MRRSLACLSAFVALCLASAPHAAQENVASATRQKYLELTRGWARQAVLTDADRVAMERGRQRERVMTDGLDDPLAREVLDRGEPSFGALASLYPGKILDRTVLGSYSDPRADAIAPSEEFVIWWNGAISAHLVKGATTPDPTRLQTLAENTNVLFRVGSSAEMFGRIGDRYSGLGYEQGYLPIVRATYESDGVRYTEIAFADRPAAGKEDVAYVRFDLENVSDATRTAELHEDIILIDGTRAALSGDQVLDASGALLIAVKAADSSYDDGLQRLTHRIQLGPRSTASVWLKIPYTPDTTRRLAASADDFLQTYDKVRGTWSRLLASGLTINVPEERVNNVWRALVLQNFVLADGPRLTYGSGLTYNDSFYPYENGFGGITMSRYGYAGAAEAWLEFLIPASVHREQAGWRYQNRRAIPFHLLYEQYLLTGKVGYFDRHKDELFAVAEEILADRRTTMTPAAERPWHWGLLPPARPGVDAIASTRDLYVVAHDITNAQGLQDFGDFLVSSGIDATRGRRYQQEADDFRAALQQAMQASVIRSPDQLPFVPLDTLYFRDTPDYGPDPYDNLALGRVQGTYYHYWANIEFRYNFFSPSDPLGRWIADYVQHRGGYVLGCVRARNRAGQPYGWINGNYNAGYYEYALDRGNVARFLLGFYSRLAFASSRRLYVHSEGSPLIGYNTHDGGFVGAEYSFPNSGANAETLDMLRALLVREERDRNRPTGVIDLALAAPRSWFENGKRIEVRNAATDFGPLSFAIASDAGTGTISAAVDAPRRTIYRALRLHLRHPRSLPITRLRVNGRPSDRFTPDGSISLPHGPAHFTIEAIYR